ncbi:MAG: NAD(P)-dependent alcohol dehydrogenase [Ornithinimicrobium sp.]
METMRVSVLRGVHDVTVEERPIPTPAADEVLVRIGSVGVCGSDMHYYEHGRIGSFVLDSPLVLGHEAGGVVTEVGSAVTSLSEGQRVSIEPGVPCRRCRQCLLGRYNLCPEVKFFATPPYDGAFCEYVAMPADFVYAVPDHVSDDAAGLVEPLSVGVWAARRSRVAPEDSVLVTGAGPIGLASAMAARAYGASSVTVADINPHRLEVARAIGFDVVDVSQTSVVDAEVHADVLLECSGNGRATWDAVHAVNRAGRVALVGMGGDEVSLPLPRIQDRELTLTGAFRYANTWPTAIELVSSGKVDLDVLVTGHFGLSEVEAALTAPGQDPQAVKVMVRPGQE